MHKKKKIVSAYKNKCPVAIKHSPSEMDGDDVFLTKSQLTKMEKANERNKGVNLKLSSAQVKHNAKHMGFLPMLAALASAILPTIAKTLGIGALSGLASSGVSKILGNCLYLKKGNSVCRIETHGKSLYLDPYPVDDFDQYGCGLYIVQGSKVMDGSGLVFGKNSFFSKIPLIGPLLGAIL